MHSPWPYSRVIAHRGGGALAPENTLSGFRKAARMGFTGVEFDVMLSADKIPLLIHDETLDRTTNGRGAVSATMYADIAALDAGEWFSPEYRGERVPTFEQVGKLCLELDLWANIEIKPARGFEEETAALTSRLASELWRRAPRMALLSSFDRTCLKVARTAAPELARGYLTDRVEAGWDDAAHRLGCISVHCNCEHLTEKQAAEIKSAGFSLLCYTVNEIDSAKRLFSWGVDAIFTDRLDLIQPRFA